jgi:hypothetical protein
MKPAAVWLENVIRGFCFSGLFLEFVVGKVVIVEGIEIEQCLAVQVFAQAEVVIANAETGSMALLKSVCWASSKSVRASSIWILCGHFDLKKALEDRLADAKIILIRHGDVVFFPRFPLPGKVLRLNPHEGAPHCLFHFPHWRLLHIDTTLISRIICSCCTG